MGSSFRWSDSEEYFLESIWFNLNKIDSKVSFVCRDFRAGR